MIEQIPMAIFALSDIDSVHAIHALIEHWDAELTYHLIYATPLEGETERVWCQEFFAGNVFSALVETIQSRIILCEPMPVTLIVTSAVIVDVDTTLHSENIESWDNPADGDDPDPFLDLRDGDPYFT